MSQANDASKNWAQAQAELRAEFKFAQPTREMIARRAYDMWQAAVRLTNEPSQYWIAAEKQLRAELKKSSSRRAPRATRTAAKRKAAPATRTTIKKDYRLAA